MPDKYVGSVPYVVGKPWDRAAIELHEFLRKLNFAHNLQVDLNAASVSGGNTSGSLTPISSGTLYFSASNNLTINQSGNSLGILGPGLLSVGVSTGGNTAGTTGLVASRLVLYGGSNVSLSQSVSGQSATITWNVHPPIGIAAGTQTATTGTIIFSNANGVTFGMSGSNTITASVAAGAADGYNIIAAGSQTAATTGTIKFENSNRITFGMSNSTQVTASYGGILLTAGTLGGVVRDALEFADTYGVSFGLNGSTITASVKEDWAVSDHSHGNPTLALTNLSGTTASASNGFTLSLSAGAGGAGDGYNIIAAGTQTANTTGTVKFADSNGITFGMSNSTQVTADFGWYLSAGTTDNTAAKSLRFVDINGVSWGMIAGGTRISASIRTDYASSDHSHGNPTLALTNLTGTTASASNGLTLSLSAGAEGTQTLGLSNITAGGATGGTTGDVSGTGIKYIFVPGSNITMSQSVNGASGTLSIYAPAGGAGGSQSIGMSTQTAGGGTGGTTGYAQGSAIQYLLVPGSNITMSQSVNGSSGTISIYAPTGGGGNTLSYYANIDAFCGTQTMTMLQSTSGMFPFVVPYNVSIGFVRIPVSGSVLAASSTAATTGNSSFSGGHWRTFNMVIYTRGAGASSDSLQSYGSTSAGMSYSIAVSCAANSTQHSYSLRYTLPCSSGTTGFTKDYSSSAASLNFHTSRVTDLTGNKILEIPFATLLTPGQYFLGFGVSSTTSTQRTADLSRAGIAFTHFGVSQINSAWGTFGAATNSSVNIQPGIGSFTTAGGGTTASVELTRLSSSASQNLLYFQLMRVT